jgi:hypothetical protein
MAQVNNLSSGSDRHVTANFNRVDEGDHILEQVAYIDEPTLTGSIETKNINRDPSQFSGSLDQANEI